VDVIIGRQLEGRGAKEERKDGKEKIENAGMDV
jgi:hypothetical protein